MALTFPLPEIAESRCYLGLGLQQASYLVIPGTSDYTTNGYVITAAQCRLLRLMSVSVDAINAAGNATAYYFTPILAITYTAGGQPVLPTQFLLYAATVTAGAYAQAGAGQNLTGYVAVITVTGY